MDGYEKTGEPEGNDWVRTWAQGQLCPKSRT